MRTSALVIPAKAGTHRPRARPRLRPVGPRHDLPQDGLPGAGHLLGAAAWGERGCGDDVRIKLGRWFCNSEYDTHYGMILYQAADTVALTGLTKSQLREWCSVRHLLPPDVPPAGPGRHALFTWQTALALRVLKSLHDDWAGEVSSWAPAVRSFRESLGEVPFPALWGTAVVFDQLRSTRIVKLPQMIGELGALSIPLDPHLSVLAQSLAIPPPQQLHLFPPMAITR